MTIFRRKAAGLLRFVLMGALCCWVGVRAYGEDTAGEGVGMDAALAGKILADPLLGKVMSRAEELLRTGLNAGSGYGEVWIRDLNTFIELSLAVNDTAPIREGLITFLRFQGPDGDIVDGFIPRDRANIGYKYRSSETAPDLVAHKNTVETDQESSWVQAVRKYVDVTGDRSILDERVGDSSVRGGLERALDYVMTHRLDEKTGLVWGATTADWGDVQPEHEWGVELDERSHRAIDIYDNGMFLIAIRDFLNLMGADFAGREKWIRVDMALRERVRRLLWDGERNQFIPHLYLNGSPFQGAFGFNESEVYYHGGTAVAIEAGLLSREEVKGALERMRANVQAAGAATIGLTMYPAYPDGFFKNPGMGAYSYQNGGDWSWFGGRMIQQLVVYGYYEDAYAELLPMLKRVEERNGFYEWWTVGNEPRGSGMFRGSAGVLGKSIRMLQKCAKGRVGEKPATK